MKANDIVEYSSAEPSANIRERVMKARKIQAERFPKNGIALNAMMSTELIKKFCVLDNRMQQLLYDAINKYKLSVRSYYKVLKVARTIADLDERNHITTDDILEALSYREVENILYNKPFYKKHIIYS